MGLITDADGRTFLAPDIFGPSPANDQSFLPQLGMPGVPPPAPESAAPPPMAPALPITGDASPAPVLGQPQPPAQPLVQPDFKAGTVTPAGAVIPPGQPVPTAAQEKQQAKAAAKKAAFDATTEGQAQQAGNEALAAKQKEIGATNEQTGIAQKEAGEVYVQEQASQQRADEIHRDWAAEQTQYKEGLADKQKQYDAAVKAETDYKVDDNRKWKEMGTGRTVAFWISAALSGLGDALQHKSGPNAALQMMQQAIDKDVQAQIRDHETLEKRVGQAKGSIDNYRQMTGDMNDAYKLKLSEEYDRTARQVRLVASKYASDKAKANGETLASQLEGQAAAIRGQTAEAAFNRDYKRKELGVQYAQLDQQKKQFEWTKQKDMAELGLKHDQLQAEGKAKEAQMVNEHGIGGVVRAKMENGKPVIGPDGKPVLEQDVIVAPFAQKEQLGKLQEQKAASDTMINTIDRVGHLMQGGWRSDIVKSDEWRQMKADWGHLVLETAKFFDLGAISKEDQDLVNSFLSTDDPTKFRDQMPGIMQVRANIVQKMNDKLRSVGAKTLDGNVANYEPINMANPLAPVMSGGDKDFKKTLKFANQDPSKWSPDAQKSLDYANPNWRQQQTEGKANLDNVIGGLVNMARNPNATGAQRDAALTALTQGATQATQKSTRDAYAAALNAARGSHDQNYDISQIAAQNRSTLPPPAPPPNPLLLPGVR